MPIDLAKYSEDRIVNLSNRLGATLEFGESMTDFDDDKDKKGSTLAKVGAGLAGAGALGAGAVYARGKMASGGNAKGKDAFRVGARAIGNDVAGVKKKVGDMANDARFHGAYRAGAVKDAVKGGVKKAGMKAGGALRSAGSAVTKVAKRFDAIERAIELSSTLRQVTNFETIDNATARKPVNKDKAPNHSALVGVGMGTVGAAAGYAGGMRHKQIMKSGKKHAAQIGKATHRGITVAKAGYKSAAGKIGAGLRPMSSAIVSKFRK